MTSDDPQELSEEERDAYLREWYLWHMEHEPDPGPDDSHMILVVTIHPLPAFL